MRSILAPQTGKDALFVHFGRPLVGQRDERPFGIVAGESQPGDKVAACPGGDPGLDIIELQTIWRWSQQADFRARGAVANATQQA